MLRVLPAVAFVVGMISVAHAGTVRTIVLPKKTFTVYRVEIQSPSGDPLTAGSAANQFTLAGLNGVVTVPVQASVTPSRVTPNVTDLIKWTFAALPAGVTVSWDHPWPTDPASGQGANAVATLRGYPASNNDFGVKTLNMVLIRKSDGKVFNQRSATLALFFKQGDTATGRTPQVPNWYFYWSQTSATFGPHVYGPTDPGNTGFTAFEGGHWVAHIQSAQGSTAGGTWGNASGIDLFANLCRHEGEHRIDLSALWGATSPRDPAKDLDGDGLPGATEPTLVANHAYDPANARTFPDHFQYLDPASTLNIPDAEDYCLLREPAWTNGDADDEDWSDPGKQHY